MAERTELPSGTLVVSERLPGVKSVSVGLYFPTGSRDETPTTNGISHLIEHLAFKGTPARTADQVNREIDLLGGAANAFTSKEILCFHARVLSEHLPRIITLFGDLAANALPPGVEEEVERERGVILSEIASVEDSPEDLAGDLCDVAFFGDHPLGLPVVGSASAVQRLKLPEIREHFSRHLVARHLVVSASGDLDHEALVRQVRDGLAGLPTSGSRNGSSPPAPRGAVHTIERDLEQVQVCLAGDGVPRASPRRPAAELLSVVLGEGCSSRLFREVRERRGLAYAIASGLAPYQDTGSFHVSFGVAPERLEEAVSVVLRVLGEARSSGVTADELATAKSQVRTALRLSHEGTGTRMAHLAEQTLLGQGETGLEPLIASYDRVGLGEVNDLAAEFLAAPLAVGAVGPLRSEVFSPGGLEVTA